MFGPIDIGSLALVADPTDIQPVSHRAQRETGAVTVDRCPECAAPVLLGEPTDDRCLDRVGGSVVRVGWLRGRRATGFPTDDATVG